MHELVHVITHYALGPQLPPWLMEGLAEDLAYSRVDSQGELLLGSLDAWRSSRLLEISSGPRRRTLTSVYSAGGPALNLDALLERWSQPVRPSVRALVGMPWAEFMEAEARLVHYTMSAFWVRYLLADTELAAPFRTWLAGLARGEEADAETLTGYLGRGWDELEAGFERWIRRPKARRGRP